MTMVEAQRLIEALTHEVSDATALPCAPKVSVGMVTYQHAGLLGQALEGALFQQCPFDYEIVVADDGSTDGTGEVAREYQAKYPGRIRVLLARENLGRHTGGPHLNALRMLQTCRGEHVALLEGDDYWFNNSKLAKQVAVLEEDSACNLVAHRVLADDGGGQLRPFDPHSRPGVVQLEELLQDFFPGTCTMMFRGSALLREFEPWMFQLPGLAGALTYRALETGHMRFMEEAMAVYRIHSGGIHSPLSRADKLKKAIEGRVMLRAHRYGKSPGLKRYLQQLARDLLKEYIKAGEQDKAREYFRRKLPRDLQCNSGILLLRALLSFPVVTRALLDLKKNRSF